MTPSGPSDWDERHRAGTPVDPSPPEGFSAELWPTAGRALDVACGRGAQAVWAAGRGMGVVALDRSSVAVALTRELAERWSVAPRLDARVHDLDQGLPPGLGTFELVICQRYRDPDLVPDLVAHLSPGGVLVCTVLSEVGAERAGRHHAPAGELRRAVEATTATIVREREGQGTATVVARLGPQAC